MVHGILQFTPSIAFRYVLHRRESRDIRCRESFRYDRSHLARRASGGKAAHAMLPFLGAIPAGVRSCAKPCPAPPLPLLEQAVRCGLSRQSRAPCHVRRRAPDDLFQHVRGSLCLAIFDNDPSAGSPTETLLRLLLPLNDKVQWTSRDVAGRKPPTSPRSEHFTGPFNR